MFSCIAQSRIHSHLQLVQLLQLQCKKSFTQSSTQLQRSKLQVWLDHQSVKTCEYQVCRYQVGSPYYWKSWIPSLIRTTAQTPGCEQLIHPSIIFCLLCYDSFFFFTHIFVSINSFFLEGAYLHKVQNLASHRISSHSWQKTRAAR